MDGMKEIIILYKRKKMERKRKVGGHPGSIALFRTVPPRKKKKEKKMKQNRTRTKNGRTGTRTRGDRIHFFVHSALGLTPMTDVVCDSERPGAACHLHGKKMAGFIFHSAS